MIKRAMAAMRVLPEVTITCHVCASRFAVKNRVDGEGPRRVVVQDPPVCPFCDAPFKTIPRIDVGIAKGLLLTEIGAPIEKKEYGSAERFFDRFTRTEEDVEALLALALAMDYDRWEADNADRRRRDSKAGVAQAPFLPRLRAASASGRLAAVLGAAAGAVKERHRAERERHMAIFVERKG